MGELQQLEDCEQELEQLSQDPPAPADVAAPLTSSRGTAPPTRSLRPGQQASKEEQQAAAKRLFKCVTGVLNGGFLAEVAADYAHDVFVWLGQSGGTLDEPLLSACDALAA